MADKKPRATAAEGDRLFELVTSLEGEAYSRFWELIVTDDRSPICEWWRRRKAVNGETRSHINALREAGEKYSSAVDKSHESMEKYASALQEYASITQDNLTYVQQNLARFKRPKKDALWTLVHRLVETMPHKTKRDWATIRDACRHEDWRLVVNQKSPKESVHWDEGAVKVWVDGHLITAQSLRRNYQRWVKEQKGRGQS